MRPARRDEPAGGIEELLGSAALQVFEHEDPQLFDRWLADVGPRFLGGLGLRDVPRGTGQRLVGLLGRAIWNVTPLPSQGFRPSPRLLPGDGEACLCGSGEVYAACCGQLPPAPAIPVAAIWQALAERAPLELLLGAASLRALPGEWLGTLAGRLLGAGRTPETLALLEGAFAQEPVTAGPDALDTYLDLVADSQGSAAAEALAEQLLGRVDAISRAVVWARRGGEALASGDEAAARRCLDEGRREDPENTGLVAVELGLLARSGRFDEVVRQARHWQERLEPLLESGEAEELRELLESAIAKPRGLGGEGLPGGAAGRHAAVLEALEEGLARPARPCGLELGDGHGRLSLEGATRGAEAAWHAFWGRRDSEGRSPVTEAEVAELLRGTPELFDSPDVLHALAEIGEELERQGVAAPAARLVDRLYERGEEILRRALAAAPAGSTLPWSSIENRAALELLADSARRHERARRKEAARACAQALLALDPADHLAAAEILARNAAPPRTPRADAGRPRRPRRR